MISSWSELCINHPGRRSGWCGPGLSVRALGWEQGPGCLSSLEVSFRESSVSWGDTDRYKWASFPFYLMKQKPRFLESFINSPLISESICSLSSALCWPTQISQAVPVTHASVPAVALSLFSPFPGPFMGFRWPYLYFFSCINMLTQLGSSNMITWKFPCLCLLIASLSSLLIH